MVTQKQDDLEAAGASPDETLADITKILYSTEVRAIVLVAPIGAHRRVQEGFEVPDTVEEHLDEEETF